MLNDGYYRNKIPLMAKEVETLEAVETNRPISCRLIQAVLSSN